MPTTERHVARPPGVPTRPAELVARLRARAERLLERAERAADRADRYDTAGDTHRAHVARFYARAFAGEAVALHDAAPAIALAALDPPPRP